MNLLEFFFYRIYEFLYSPATAVIPPSVILSSVTPVISVTDSTASVAPSSVFYVTDTNAFSSVIPPVAPVISPVAFGVIGPLDCYFFFFFFFFFFLNSLLAYRKPSWPRARPEKKRKSY